MLRRRSSPTGVAARGSQRWIDIGFFRFQPSEFGKVLLRPLPRGLPRRPRAADRRAAHGRLGAVALAAVADRCSSSSSPTSAPRSCTRPRSPPCSSSPATRWLHLAVLAAAAALLALAVLWWLPAAGVQVLKPYQADRLTGFIDPDADPSGATYNVNQSITAVGAGRAGRARRRGRHADAASTTCPSTRPTSSSRRSPSSAASSARRSCCCSTCSWSGEGCKIVAVARDLFAAIVAGGIVFAFLFQVFVNVGMTIGIAPITGIPLPFVSVGGSSMIANLLAIGVLQAIHASRSQRRVCADRCADRRRAVRG